MRSSSSAFGYPSEVRSRNRSSCASGSGNVPSCSIGFSVAIRKNGSGRRRVAPSTVTCCSAIASSSADCALGSARFTSSTRRTFANTGPARNSNSRVFGFQIERPVMSVGWRSGVHWTRDATAPSMLPAIERARTVLAVPGTSSRSTWPREASAATTSATVSLLPSTTVSTFCRKRPATSIAPSKTVLSVASRTGRS